MKKDNTRFSLIIVSIFMVFGLVMFFGNFNQSNPLTMENIILLFKTTDGMPVVFLFFIGIGIAVWVQFIKQKIVKPKEVIMYLKSTEKNTYYFLNTKGYQYSYINISKSYKVNKFYKVKMLSGKILEIIAEVKDKYPIPKERVAYWHNFYTPFKEFEKQTVLPALYVALILLIIIEFSSSSLNIIDLFGIGGIAFLIVYDFIYKTKLNQKLNNQDVNLDDFTLNSRNFIFKTGALIQCAAFVILIIILLNLFSHIQNGYIIFFIPFLILFLANFLMAIIKLFNIDLKYYKLLTKISMLCFTIYWFMLCGYVSFYALSSKDFIFALLLIPFWLVGIYLFKLINKN